MPKTVYTAFEGNIWISKDFPQEDYLILGYMVDPFPPGSGAPANLPDHPLFKTSGWETMFRDRAEDPSLVGCLDDVISWCLTFKCLLPNNDRELHLFIDWIGDHVVKGFVRSRKATDPDWSLVRWLPAEADPDAKAHQP